uniref:SJCHGC02958 protein n=1 Tax=Schistosoma japonicum TaxID=6182 RepID=Q5BT26_SCHJA|nr:SJCHGC02958 protein [Schistosoma japonicum]
MSEEEIAIEKMCDFERYLEMQVDVHELAIQDGCILEWDMQHEPNKAIGISLLSIGSSKT